MSEESAPLNMFKEHEKFWAFAFLIISVLALVLLASTFDKGTTATDLVMQAKLRIIDAAITGLLTITGMAAQALFRVSSVDRQNAATFTRALDKMPDTPKEVIVTNPASDPINVVEILPAHTDETLPEYAR